MPSRQESSSGKFALQSEDICGLPILNRFLDRLQFDRLVTKHLAPPDVRAKLRPAEALGVLVRNVVLCHAPLYSQSEWARRMVPELVGLHPEQIGLINDDRIGRALDRLFDADRTALLTDFVVHLVKEFNVELEQFHNDSTTITLQGEYAAADGRPIRGKKTILATQGHKKDHRPDLKQLLWILTVSADGAVPVHFKVTDGNTEDSTTHIETWDVLRRLVGKPDFLYVADSKLCTRESLRYIKNEHGWFITILPRTRREDGLFRDWLQQNTPAWEEIDLGRRPRLKDGVAEVVKAIESPSPDADDYRLIWVFSSLKRERDFLARKGCIERAFKELDALRQKLVGTRCRITSSAGVAKAADSILEKTAAGRWITYQIVQVDKATFRQEKRGRGGKDTRFRRTIKPRFELTITANAENIA